MNNPAPASLSAAKAYLERIRLAAERTGMTECETLLDEMVATFEEAAREREGMREALDELKIAAGRALGSHAAPYDCYATGPLTGDSYRDLVECPGCVLNAILNRAALQPSPAESETP